MYIPLGIKTDYSLLSSLIKIGDLIKFLKENNINAVGIIDDNLYGVMELYDNCQKNNIKPIIGLSIKLNSKKIYLYAKNNSGYQNLLKINTIISSNQITINDLRLYNKDLIAVIPYQSIELYENLKEDFDDIYLGYLNDSEKRNSLLITSKVLFINEIKCLEEKELKYLSYLYQIKESELDDNKYYYYLKNIDTEDVKTTIEFINKIDITIEKEKRYIPIFDKEKDSFSYLYALTNKGLEKRLNGNVPKEYQDRLNYELNVIKNMGFVDYFLIVYDYVKYAKTHDILVGPGRGSAAGSLVSYTLGITNIDPLKYNLLFERFLNPERVTMPDIDIDFEDTKRGEMIDYVRKRYGNMRVAPIMAFATLGTRQVLKDVCKAINNNTYLIDSISKMIDPKLSLKENLANEQINKIVLSNSKLKEIYQISMRLEGLKRHISTHAAGVVISSIDLDEIIPVIKTGEYINTGLTMNYLEELGLIKMDFLAISNLTVIHNAINLIGNNFDINKINLEDPNVFKLFQSGDTHGIFQYESSGMRKFLIELKPTSFNDLIAAVALFRPGPMENIGTYIKRKEGKEIITYLHPDLEPILKETYGIIVYQEQIMQILRKMASFSYAKADNIRRAMSKKKSEIIIQEKDNFINSSIKNGYSKEIASEVYELILKFANYGFNKSHSVSYALVGYQMAYLKTYHREIFLGNLLNMNIGSDIKTRDYLNEAKLYNIYILKPDINLSNIEYKVGKKKIRMPLSTIKNVGEASSKIIIEEREENGTYKDYFDFVSRVYKKKINKKVIESLIHSGALDSFSYNHQTLVENLDSAIRYSYLLEDLDASLVEVPIMIEKEEYSKDILMTREFECFGFYVSNHPSSKYSGPNIVKSKDIKSNFNKNINMVALVNGINKIKTKSNTDMAFASLNDEYGSIDIVIFPNKMEMIKDIKKNDLVSIYGVVERRFDKYQINIKKISKVSL